MRKILCLICSVLIFSLKNEAQSVFMLTYAAPPTLTVSPTSLNLGSTTAGSSGSNFTYSLSGVHLTGNATVTAPSGTGVSLDGTTFSTSVTVNQSGGNISSTTIYARISASASVGSISGNITNTSTGSNNPNVAVSGTVNATGSNDTINVQVWDSIRNVGKFTNAAWNNWSPQNATAGSLTSAPLKYATGVSSPITLKTDAYNDYLLTTGGFGSSNTMGYPAGAFNIILYQTVVVQTFTFQNVSAGTYRVEIVSGTNSGAGPYSATWASGSAAQTVNAFNNTSTLVVLDNLTPSSGNIVITGTPANGYVIMDAIRLIRKN